nr:unnamed protein product [Callosobruchus chinensis]
MLGYALYPKPRSIIVRSSVSSKRKIFLPHISPAL